MIRTYWFLMLCLVFTACNASTSPTTGKPLQRRQLIMQISVLLTLFPRQRRCLRLMMMTIIDDDYYGDGDDGDDNDKDDGDDDDDGNDDDDDGQ